MYHKRLILLTIATFCIHSSYSLVLELDDRFREAKKQGEWLVMFYAPWCGHCKQLEPTWMEIGDAMQGQLPVHVARLDCTKYSSVSGEFGVRGFPTIKFISGTNDYEYRGARTKNEIIAFVRKARGPKLSVITSADAIGMTQNMYPVFFVYVGEEDTALRKSYDAAADKVFLSLHLFAALPGVMPHISDTPTVLVFKDDTHYRMPLSSQSTKQSQLSHWMLSEQLPDYTQLTGSSYHSLKGTHKSFAVVVLPEDDSETLNSIAKEVATSRNPLFHPKFIFCWVLGNSIINKITYSTISPPNFIVFNPSTYEYYEMRSSAESSDATIAKSEITKFLGDVIEGKLSAQGGSSVFQQLKRFVSDTTSTVINFFKDSPVVASLVIGLPTFVITFLCYCLCTMEDSGPEAYGTDSENEYDEDERDEESERLPEYEDEEDEGVRRRQLEQEPEGENEHAAGDGDNVTETEKDK